MRLIGQIVVSLPRVLGAIYWMMATGDVRRRWLLFKCWLFSFFLNLIITIVSLILLKIYVNNAIIAWAEEYNTSHDEMVDKMEEDWKTDTVLGRPDCYDKNGKYLGDDATATDEVTGFETNLMCSDFPADDYKIDETVREAQSVVANSVSNLILIAMTIAMIIQMLWDLYGVCIMGSYANSPAKASEPTAQ